ncbi:MAG: NHLP family bacteriocin export ABC transporter peptidase/permease/ATPase subunit [Anaerolineales bacterium]
MSEKYPLGKSPDPISANKRVRTPTVLQMEAVECGAAALGMVLGYYGRILPLEELRLECGVSRDGSKASNIAKAARKFGLEAKGFRKEPKELHYLPLPIIVFWNFNHFIVVEGFKNGKVYINDPAMGPRTLTDEEFDQSFTGVAIGFQKTEDFTKGGRKPSLIGALRRRLRGSEAALLYILLASIALTVPGLLLPTFTRLFVDNVLVRGEDRMLDGILLGLLGISLALGLLTLIQLTYLLRLETKLAVSTSSKFFWHILRLPMYFFTQRYSGDVSNRIEINNRVAELLSRDLATTMLGLLLVVFYAALMIQYDIILTLIGVGIALINLFALRYFSRRRRDANQRLLQENSGLMGVSMNGLQIIETLKATGSESDFFANWAGSHAKTINAEQQLNMLSRTLNVIPPLLIALNTAVILVVGSWRVMDGALTVGMLVAFQVLMASFLQPVTDMVNLGSRLQEAEGDMNRLDDVLRHQRDPEIERDSGETIQTIKLSGAVELRNVTFGYSLLEQPLIQDLSLSIQPGERIALVGGSGSGKSTVAKLIVGLYAPWEGDILFDDQSRKHIPRTTLSNSIAMVDQDIFLFEGTVRENLTLWDDTIPQARVVQATQDAQIYREISERPGAYHYMIEEGGRNWSGGQRQRLEIARALVNDPSILVLDEATSALDPITEKAIADNLRIRGCTTIIVAHRLSTIRDVDEIIVLDHGQIVQRGSHEELITQEGHYAQLIKAEAPQRQRNKLDQIFDQLGDL